MTSKEFVYMIICLAILAGLVAVIVKKAEAPTSCVHDVSTAVQAEKDWWMDTHTGIMDAMERGDMLLVQGGEDLMTRRMYE